MQGAKETPPVGRRLLRRRRRRTVVLLALLAATAIAVAAGPLHQAVLAAIDDSAALVERSPVAGAAAFVLLSAASAMLAFFSTAIFTPIAIRTFGTTTTVLLLWSGWVLGGSAAYLIGRAWGRPIVARFVDPERLDDYQERARRLVSFRRVLLFQLAVPSEIPGYVLGISRCPYPTYLAGVALAELPFALGAVYLGESFLRRDVALVVAIGLGGIALTWLAHSLGRGRRPEAGGSATARRREP